MKSGVNIRAGTAAIGCIFLWSCIFSTKPTPFISRPAQLNPLDAFAKGSQRTYLWKEGWTAGKKDSAALTRVIRITNKGDTLVHDTVLRRINFIAADGLGPLPVSVVAGLGFNPDQLWLDTTAIPEPGPALGFPTLPEIGWRSETTSGDLHFVRVLKGLDTLRRSEGNVECWAFAESTYWNGSSVATSVYSLGRTGMLRLHTERTGFNPGGDTVSGISWREVAPDD